MTGSLSGLNVLIVDPDTAYAHSLGHHLSAAGATVTYAESGLTDAVATKQPAVVITELMLPGQSGLDLLAALHAQTSPPPVIVVTANHAARLKAYSQSLGATDYFVKPVDPATITKAILTAIDHE